MSAKPSRSEIENALSGQPRAARRPQVRSADAKTDAGHRRQQVIGGDLSGVASRARKDRLARIRDINIINWISVAIVLLILGAFFWPHTESGSIREVPGQVQATESESFYTESRIDEPQQAPVIEQSFSRPNDMDRASEFRTREAIDREVASLLTRAEQHVTRGEYTEPVENNAARYFNQVLLLDSSNAKARQGLEYIRGRFLNSGLAALEQDNPALAENTLLKLGTLNQDSDEYQELAAAVGEWKRQAQIAEFLTRAREAEARNQLILPARENALYYYQQILVLDESNERALAGVKTIADSYITKANDAFLGGHYEAATGYLATVSVIDPKHPSIPLIEEMITKAQPIAAESKKKGTQSSNRTPSDSRENRTSRPPASTTADRTNNQDRISGNRTPKKEASEQASFDKQYLEQGLDAYYKGDYEKAAALLQPLADKGVSRAQFRIAYMYYLGRGFKRDRKEADRIIRAALPAVCKFAEEGRGWAQSDLGSLYEDGLVLPRDYAEAVYWYRSAAEQGYPGAQTNLGIMYARGKGVTVSRKTAIEWFQRAAKQGDILAQRNLESMGVNR